MDFKNKSILLDDITSMDINKAIQRAMTKAIARHGLGLYIYAGEDLPEEEKEPVLTVESFTKRFESFNDLESLGKEVMKKETLAEYNKFGKEDKEIINKFLANKKESLEIKI